MHSISVLVLLAILEINGMSAYPTERSRDCFPLGCARIHKWPPRCENSVCTGNRSHSWDSGRVCKLIDFDCIPGPSYGGCAKLRQPGDERTGRKKAARQSWASQVRAAAGGIAPNDSDCILTFPTRKANWQNMRETI